MVSKKKSIIRVRMGYKNQSLGITIYHQSWPCHANRCSSGQIFLSHPHTHDGFLFYQIVRISIILINKWQHEIFNNVVCATSKSSNRPALTRSLIKPFARRLNIL